MSAGTRLIAVASVLAASSAISLALAAAPAPASARVVTAPSAAGQYRAQTLFASALATEQRSVQRAAAAAEARAVAVRAREHADHVFHVAHLAHERRLAYLAAAAVAARAAEARQQLAQQQAGAAAPAPAPAPQPAATASVSYTGSTSMQECIIRAESGGNSQIWNATGHYGLYQFSYGTWVAHGGAPALFGHASAAYQTQIFWQTVAADGYSDWAPYDGC